MSANASNRRAQGRGRRRAGPRNGHGSSRRGGRANLSSVSSGPSTRVNPDTVMIFSRRSADLTCYYTSSFQAVLPPGFSGSTFFAFGTPGADTLPGTSWIPFCLNFTIQCLGQSNDILNMFTEYQVRALRIEFQTLMGDSYNPGTASVLPEVVTAIDPTASNPPSSIAVVEAYQNTRRTTLTVERTHSVKVRPRPSVQLYASALATTYAFDDNVKDLWFLSNNVNSPPVYGVIGVLRNFQNVNAGGAAVRISLTAQLACRRPH